MGKHSNLVRFEKSAANTPQHGADIDGILQKGPTRHAYAWRMGPFWAGYPRYVASVAGELRSDHQFILGHV